MSSIRGGVHIQDLQISDQFAAHSNANTVNISI